MMELIVKEFLNRKKDNFLRIFPWYSDGRIRSYSTHFSVFFSNSSLKKKNKKDILKAFARHSLEKPHFMWENLSPTINKKVREFRYNFNDIFLKFKINLERNDT